MRNAASELVVLIHLPETAEIQRLGSNKIETVRFIRPTTSFISIGPKFWLAPQPQNAAPQSAPEGEGGKGGDAKVGGSGTALGGPGGQSGRYGRGGEGGTAKVQGDGIAVGGSGGAAGDEGIWRAPAKSGYEINQRKMGLPVDPVLRQYKRGGAGAGYGPKLNIIEQLRTEYFSKHSKKAESIFENINAVPLDYLNDTLSRIKETWRVRIVDDEYEFFIPKN